MFHQYLGHLHIGAGDLSSFWMSYVDLVVDVMLNLLRASREGDWSWSMHLAAIRQTELCQVPLVLLLRDVKYGRGTA